MTEAVKTIRMVASQRVGKEILVCVVDCGVDWSVFFFFQAEDGIRDSSVTGVQTCALPILGTTCGRCRRSGQPIRRRAVGRRTPAGDPGAGAGSGAAAAAARRANGESRPADRKSVV